MRTPFRIIIEVNTSLNDTQIATMVLEKLWKACEGTDMVITQADVKQLGMER